MSAREGEAALLARMKLMIEAASGVRRAGSDEMFLV